MIKISWILIICFLCFFTLQIYFSTLIQMNQIPKELIKERKLPELKREVDWIEYADYNFQIDESLLPKSKNIIFQVIITNQIDHWAGKRIDDSKVEKMTEPLCKSAKNWNEGLITLHTSSSNFSFCSSWPNSMVVKFDAKMVKHVSLHDERLFVVEQFVKKFQLQHRYR